MRTLGIVGGLGPAAGANFYHEIVKATDAVSDQEHPRVLLISDPAIPSRIDHLSGSGPDPRPKLHDVVEQLVRMGADVIALPSVTTHAYIADAQAASPVPIVNIFDAVSSALIGDGVRSVGLIQTAQSQRTRLLEAAIESAGISAIHPNETLQAEIQRIVLAAKGGVPAAELATDLDGVMSSSWTRDLDALLIGCTDLSPLATFTEQHSHDVARLYAKAVVTKLNEPSFA